jgi:glutamate/aspartate transport system substrate-binding protein
MSEAPVHAFCITSSTVRSKPKGMSAPPRPGAGDREEANGLKRAAVLAVLTVLVAGPVGAQELQGTLKRIKDTRTIILGHRDSSRPFSFVGDDRKPAGYSVELCTRVASGIQQQLGVSDLAIKWVPVTVENRIRAVVSGTIDLECGSTTNTLGRQEQVDFSLMTFIDGGSLLATAASGVRAVGDLTGKRVAVIPGTTTETALTQALQKSFVTAQIVKVKDHADGLAALETGAADGYASDRVILVALLSSARDPGQLVLSEQYLSYEPYALMLRRNDAAFRLAVNRVLARLYRTGQVAQIVDRWFVPLGRPSSLLGAMYILNSIPE